MEIAKKYAFELETKTVKPLKDKSFTCYNTDTIKLEIEVMEEFNYAEAIAELEKIAAEVENPSTGIDDIDKYIRRSDELVAKCRAYLRAARSNIDHIS